MPGTISMRGVDPRHLRSMLTTIAGGLNIALGLWLAFSVSRLHESLVARNITFVMGALITLLSVATFRLDKFRFAVAGIAVFLGFTATGVFNLKGPAMWNQLIVAFAVFALSLWPALRPTDEQP